MTEAKSEITPVAIYGLVMTASCVLLGGQLSLLGSLTSYSVPAVVCVVIGFTRYRWGLMLIPFAVFGAICHSFVWESMQVSGAQAGFLATMALVAIASSMRLLSMASPARRPQFTAPLIDTSTTAVRATPRMAPSHLISIAFVLLSWWTAGYLMSDFAYATSEPEVFLQYQGWVKRTFRLVPWAYCGIKLVIVLTIAFSLAHGVLAYLHCRSRSGLLPAMRLGNELWRWNGDEQRRIGKAHSRQQSKN